MTTSISPPKDESRHSLLLRLSRLLLQSLWTPGPDERRFLAGLPIAVFLIPFLWRHGIHPLGACLGPTIVGLWILAYLIKFWQPLKQRGELKRVVIAASAFVGLLVSVSFY